MNIPIKKHPEFIVTVDTERGFRNDTEIIRCSNFNTAVKVYRKQQEMWGKFSCKIYEEVVGYGEEI